MNWATVAEINEMAAVQPPGLAIGEVSHPTAELLHSLPLLAGLPPDEISWLARRVGYRRLRRGATMVEQGEIDNALCLLITGKVHAVRQGLNGRKLLLEVLGPGMHFGERGLIDDQPRGSTVRCVEPTLLLMIHRADFAHLMAVSSAFRARLLQALTERLRASNQRIVVMALSDVRGCVIRHLLQVSEVQDGQRMVRIPIRRQTVADQIGASREMVGRVLKALTASGMIEPQPDGTLLMHFQAAD